MFKVEGCLGGFGTPKWTEYYCSTFCLNKAGIDRGDVDRISNDDLQPSMKCRQCDCNLILVVTGHGKYPSEAPRKREHEVNSETGRCVTHSTEKELHFVIILHQQQSNENQPKPCFSGDASRWFARPGEL